MDKWLHMVILVTCCQLTVNYHTHQTFWSVTCSSLFICIQEVLLPGGHGLMVRGYQPVINTLAKGLDIRLGHRYIILV